MTIVRIGPETISVVDVLEYAKALIEEHGWRQGDRPQDLAGKTESEWETIAASGLSLHDAIGMACFRLSGETGASFGSSRKPDKDFTTGGPYGRTLRPLVTAAVTAKTKGKTDIEFNDKAKKVETIYGVLDAAMKEVATSG